MDGKRQRRPTWRCWAVAVAVAVVVLAAVTSCGRPATGPAVTPRAAVALCRDGTGLTSFVLRSDGLAGATEPPSPAATAVHDARTARLVAGALCALPVMPSGTYHCPDDTGRRAVLTFRAGPLRLAPVTLDPEGCEEVTGLGRTRWTAGTPSLWTVLGDAVGIPDDARTAFGRGAVR